MASLPSSIPLPLDGAPALDARIASLLEAHGALLSRLVRGYERDPDRARDLYQDIAAALWQALPGYRGDASEKTWVLRVAHNVAVDHAVRQRRLREREGEAIEQAPDRPAAHGGEAQLEARQRVERLTELVRALPPLDRQLILLSLEGLTPHEIAEVTGLTATNVTTRVHRIRAALRAKLEG